MTVTKGAKKSVKTITNLSLEEVIQDLQTYAKQHHIVESVIAKNRGGSKESVFNISEVESLLNKAIYKVSTKIQDFRDAIAAGKVRKKRMEDWPLIIAYFNVTFLNLLRDKALYAQSLMRSRYSEHLTSGLETNRDDGSSNNVMPSLWNKGSWEDVIKRERQDLVADALKKLRDGLVGEAEKLSTLFVKQYVHLLNKKEAAASMQISTDQVNQLIPVLNEKIKLHCSNEMRELLKLVVDNTSYWDVEQEAAVKAEKTRADAKNFTENTGITKADMTCQVTTATSYKMKERQIEVNIQVFVVRDKAGCKETVATVEEFKTTVNDLSEVNSYRASIANEFKAAKERAQIVCSERKRLAEKYYAESAA